MATMDKEVVCILGLSFCFMLLFASDNTMLNMSKVVVSSIEQERTGYHVEGYTVTGIIFTVFAASLWVGPYLNYALGCRTTMALSAVGYLIYVLSFALEDAWIIYMAAVVIGFSSGTIWPAQGHYMIRNSSEKNAGRNAGIFWFFYMTSTLVGNIFVYITFKGQKYINQTARRTAIYSLLGINTVAVLAFMALPASKKSEKDQDYGPIKAIKSSWKILTSHKMCWLILTFLYAGLQQSFWSGIYSSCIGFTLAFGEYSKELVGLSGIFMSFGGVIGALTPIIQADWIRRHSYARRCIVVTGCVAQLCGYLIAYVNLPNNAVFGNTEDTSIINSSIELALTGSVLLTFGDSCLTTQIYSIISDYYRESCIELALTGSVLLTFGDSCLTTQIYSFISDNYRENSAEACALYKFVKSVSAAVSFYWCSHLGLHTLTLILGVAAVVGVSGFCMADRNSTENLQVTEDKDKNDSRL